MGNTGSTRLDDLYALLSAADETYARIPRDIQLEVDRVTQSIPEYGPRFLRRRGLGMEFFEAREFRPATDEPRRINAKLTARAGKPIIVEREAEIRQYIYLWRDATASMNYSSGKNLHNKKTAAEIMLLALAKHLAVNEEMVGIVDGRGMHRGGKSAEILGRELNSVFVVTGDMPKMDMRMPRDSTIVLFSDFLANPDDLAVTLETMAMQGVNGHLVMVLDPQEIDFAFKGSKLFRGLEGEGRQKFNKAESKKSAYQQVLKDHIETLFSLSANCGFTLTIQRTDQPLHQALLSIYGLTAPRGPVVPGLQP